MYNTIILPMGTAALGRAGSDVCAVFMYSESKKTGTLSDTGFLSGHVLFLPSGYRHRERA